MEHPVLVDRVASEMVDWGMRRYEQTAAELAQVAEHVISLAELERGEVVVDLATGTGNAALLAARAGAVVTGLDAAPRLIDVARARAATEGVEASFVVGTSRRCRSRMARSTPRCPCSG